MSESESESGCKCRSGSERARVGVGVDGSREWVRVWNRPLWASSTPLTCDPD